MFKLVNNNKGFTLIELMVVIAVIGILAVIAVPRLTGVRDKATLSEAESAIGTIQNALEMYAMENEGNYDVDGDNKITDSASGDEPIFDYIDVDSLPDGWTYTIDEGDDTNNEGEIVANDAEDGFRILLVNTNDDDLAAELVEGNEIETTQDGDHKSDGD